MLSKINSKISILIVLIFIWLIVLSLCLFIRVEPNIKWSSETYIGIFVASIGVATAIIIGFQVINAIDVKSDLRSMRSEIDNKILKWKDTAKSLECKHSDLEKHVDSINASVREGIAVLDALRMGGEGENIGRDLDAFCKMHEALLFSLGYNSTNYDFIFSKLIEFGSRICTQTFGTGFAMNKDGFYYTSPNSPHYQKKLTDIVDNEILPQIKEVESQIRNNANFIRISYNYDDLMRRFYSRVKVASTQFFPENIEEFEKF